MADEVWSQCEQTIVLLTAYLACQSDPGISEVMHTWELLCNTLLSVIASVKSESHPEIPGFHQKPGPYIICKYDYW